MIKLKALILEDCYYSSKLVELLNNFNIHFEQFDVKQINKEKYKTAFISTFPQLYLILDSGDNILIGGYEKTSSIIDLIKNNEFDIILNKLNKEFPNENKKNKLRIIRAFM
jgi:hypothetical protein